MSSSRPLVSFATSASDAGLASSGRLIRVFMMDLWCYTPYYDRYLCESLASENIEVILGSVCPYEDPKYFAKNGLHNDPGLVDIVPKLGISNDTLRRALMLVESSVNMAALLARFAVSKPDIVHVQWAPLIRKLPFEIWFFSFLKRLKIKLVYTVHNVLPHDSGTKFLPVFERVYRQMDALICHTHEAKNRLVREFSVDPERVLTIPHGPLFHDSERLSVQASRAQLSLPQDTTLVFWQGIMRPYKGLDFLLEAWHRIAHSVNALLIVAGTGESSLLGAIKEKVSRLGLQESVRLDFRFIPDEELSAYYQASDVLVFPYREVTTSGAFMTALTYRKAMVVTKLPAFQEALKGRETALFVNYGDIEGLASALSKLICEPKERQRLADALTAWGSCENSWALIAKDTRRCYTAVLEGH